MPAAYRPVVSPSVRVLVVANPRATATSPRQRRVLLDALQRTADVVLEETANRGHAAALACRAMRERYDVVVALGGDGTVNEVVNGLLTDGVHDHVPSVGVVPAGSTNVFARALGLPNDPIEATGALLEALSAGRSVWAGPTTGGSCSPPAWASTPPSSPPSNARVARDVGRPTRSTYERRSSSMAPACDPDRQSPWNARTVSRSVTCTSSSSPT